MNSLKIILISILIVLILFNTIVLQIFSVFSNTFLKPSFYEKIGVEQEFYGQIRQLMFRLISRSLPNGSEGMPYFEEALTESWLKNEIDQLITQFFDFIKGRNEEPPIIPIYKLKEKVTQSIGGDRTLAEKQKMVQYWFDPLPDIVRLQDFISMQVIFDLKKIIITMQRLLFFLLVIFFILLVLMYAIVQEWKTALLWISTATMASGIQTIMIGLGLGWLLKRSSYIIEFYNSIVAYEIPKESAWGLIESIKNGITEPLILVGAIVTVISGAIIYLIPIKKRSLTLIK